MNTASEPKLLLDWLTPQLPNMLRTLETFVRSESSSTEKIAADICAQVIAAEWNKRDVAVELLQQKNRGAHLRIAYVAGDTKPHSQLLVLCHYDTAYATATLAKMPFRTAAGRIYDPGVFDMKAGIVQALFALDAVQHSRAALAKKIVFLWTSDEEIGSASSRKWLGSDELRSDSVFVLEPALGVR